MKGGLILFVALCALAAAMVVRDKRAVGDSSPKGLKKCDKLPCAWSIYNPQVAVADRYNTAVNITNEHCECEPGTTCKFDEDDDSASTLVHRCKKQNQGQTPEVNGKASALRHH